MTALSPGETVPYVDTPASGRAGFQTGASVDPSVQHLLLAVRALGLGSYLTTRHRRRKARLQEILGIPDRIESAAIIPLGWPDRDDGPNRRPPLARFVRYDRRSGSTMPMHMRHTAPLPIAYLLDITNPETACDR